MKADALIGGALGLASGVALRSFFIVDVQALLVVSAGALLLVGMCHATARVNAQSAWALCAFSICVVLGVSRFASVEADYTTAVAHLASEEGRTVVVEGVVVRDVEITERGRVLIVESTTVDSERFTATFRVTTDVGQPIVFGDHVTARGVVARPESFATDLGRTFRYEEYLRAQGVSHTLLYADLKVHEGYRGYSPIHALFGALYAFKRQALLGIERVLPEPHAGFGEGLLLGEKHALGESLEETFRTVGIIHIIVLSGYNLTIVAESLMRLLSRFLYPRTCVYVGVGAVVLFAVMVGLSATVVRAAIMATLVLVARAWGKTYAVMRGLALAGACMVLVNPYVLAFDPGFQLSFLATLGLIFVAPLVEQGLTFAPTTFQMREYMTATLSTQIFVTPFLLFSMGSMSLVSIVANVLVLAVVPLTMLSVFVAGVAGMLFGDVALMVGYPAYLLLSYILAVADALSQVPYALLSVAPFSVSYMLLAYGVMLSALYVLWKRVPHESDDARET